jgi:hypothetical protein
VFKHAENLRFAGLGKIADFNLKKGGLLLFGVLGGLAGLFSAAWADGGLLGCVRHPHTVMQDVIEASIWRRFPMFINQAKTAPITAFKTGFLELKCHP